MTLEVQFNLKRNPIYLDYLHAHSYWYKVLNRSPEMFRSFEEEVKSFYKLRASDRISNALSTIEMLETVISTLSS